MDVGLPSVPSPPAQAPPRDEGWRVEPVNRVEPAEQSEARLRQEDARSREFQQRQERSLRGRQDDTRSRETEQRQARSQIARQEEQDRERESRRLEKAAEPSFKDAGTKLSIVYDERIESFVYRGLDPKTGEVVREYPPEEVLERLARAKLQAGTAIDRSA